MANGKRQSFLHGAMILIVATVIVKIIGVFFKLPLTNIIGASGMGYFNIAYGLFNTLYALSVAGLPVAVAKLVAESSARGHYRDVRRLHSISMVAFFTTGILGSVLMYFGARPYIAFNKNEDALLAVTAMAPAIFFVCVTSAYRGYYEGLRNMYPTAVSQVVEALGKLVFGMLFAVKVVEHGMAEFARAGTVFGTVCESAESAQLAVLPYAAAGAIAGIVASSVLGTLYLVLRHRIGGDGIGKAELAAAPPPTGRRVLLRRLLRLSIPVCLGALVLNITTLIDLSSITNRLATALQTDAAAVLSMYSGAIPAAMQLSGVPNYLYGSYTMAVTIFNLVPSITTTFGISALPVVAAAWGASRRDALERNIESVLRITGMVAFPAGLGLFVLAEPVLALIYRSEPAAVQIAAPLLRTLGIAVLFVAFSTPVSNMLQAIGRVGLPVRLMLVGGALKLVINFIFIAVPGINIQIAPYGTLACYAAIVLLGVPALAKNAGIKIRAWRTFGKPFFAAVLCAAGAWAAWPLAVRLLGHGGGTAAAIVLAMLIDTISLLLLRAIRHDDILMLPNGEKIAKTLEKYGLIS